MVNIASPTVASALRGRCDSRTVCLLPIVTVLVREHAQMDAEPLGHEGLADDVVGLEASVFTQAG